VPDSGWFRNRWPFLEECGRNERATPTINLAFTKSTIHSCGCELIVLFDDKKLKGATQEHPADKLP
jgi:hypothetical protein